ncbi:MULTISPECIES: Arc family DNA-binding protein [unclassified Pseudomonas]|uniref:Arc family DNA-binding protein n=1 Tax=unclassified Pseudomonas TaxID=196821 RepID=UPI00148207CF|nr:MULTISPECIES: Arc family DNA-binding protein [unclassified Pseudomonas]
MAETVDRFVLRLPEGLRQTLKRIAKQNQRSLNAEIVSRMERSLAGPRGHDSDDEKRQALLRAFFDHTDEVN